jgi:tRNA(Arg) A34 adenosine deaminase TadA
MDTGGAVNRAELRQVLDQKSFDPATYSLEDGLEDDAFCLGRRHEKWVVY